MRYNSDGKLLVSADITSGGGSGGTSDASLTSIDGKIVARAALTDATTNPTISPWGAFLQGFNGSTWDRVRTGAIGAMSSVLGYLNVIPVGRYNATPPTLTDGQFINPQLDINGRSLPGAGLAYRSTATGTRAANTTAYAANDVYGGVVELPNIGASGGFVILNQLRVMFSLSAVPSGMRNFTVYLYDSAPPSAVADNGAFSVPAGDRSALLTPAGLAGVATLAQGGGSVVMQIADINRVLKLANGSTSLWAYFVTSGAFTPAASTETFAVTALALGV